jgi:hypothetical protein
MIDLENLEHVCEGLRPLKNWNFPSFGLPRQKIVKGDFLNRYSDPTELSEVEIE